jgi:PAS domain S-box-containing protein
VRDSEARYRALAENSHDVIWTADISTRRYTYASPSIREMTGYTVEEVVGQPIDSWLTAESAGRLAREVDQSLRRIAAGDVLVSELELVCKDGGQYSLRWLPATCWMRTGWRAAFSGLRATSASARRRKAR